MIGALARRLFGSANDRYIKSLGATVAEINALEPEVEKLSDEQLAARTVAFRERLAQGETLDDMLAEAFAARRRTRVQEHRDRQRQDARGEHAGRHREVL